MPHIKSSFFLLLLLLGSFCHVLAQTDTGAAHTTADTAHHGGETILRTGAVSHGPGDTILAKKPARVSHPKKPDSLSLTTRTGLLNSSRKDSLPVPAAGPVTAAPAVPVAGLKPTGEVEIRQAGDTGLP